MYQLVLSAYTNPAVRLSMGLILASLLTACGSSGDGPPALKSIAATAGGFHTCALLPDGTVQCWGQNTDGQLGNGTNTGPETCPDNNACSTTPVAVTGISTATAVSAGGFHACALLSGGTVQCWGQNTDGQLGNGTNTGPETCPDNNACSTTPVPVTGISTATAVTAGKFYHTCALLSDGTVQCWGQNTEGQLGNGTNTGPETCPDNTPCSTTPVAVTGISTATSITAGGVHTCALLSSGTVQCWGRNLEGQLGNGDVSDSSTPVTVMGISTATAITAGKFHTCALLSSGTVQCWGRNAEGQLGNGTNTGPETCPNDIPCSSTPVPVTGISTAMAITAGGFHTCALLSSGTVQCWGRNAEGQLGNGINTGPETCPDNTPCSTTPVAVTGISTATAITGGAFHTCAHLSDNTLQCWGLNDTGEIGNGTTTYSLTPNTVIGL